MRVYVKRATKKGELDRLLVDSAWRRQPVLIGTGSVVESDEISGWLTSWRARPPAELFAHATGRAVMSMRALLEGLALHAQWGQGLL